MVRCPIGSRVNAELQTKFHLPLRENAVGLFQRFLGADVVPDAGHFPGVDGDAGVKPLHEAAGLVGIVALGDVLMDQRQHGFRIIIERNAGQRAGGLLGFLLEEGDFAGAIYGDGVVFFDFLEVADVINARAPGFFVLRAKVPKPSSFSLKRLSPATTMTSSLTFSRVSTRCRSPMAPSLLVSSVEWSLTMVKFRACLAARLGIGPFLEMPGELRVGDDIHAVEPGDAREFVQHVVNHGFAGDGEQRLGLVEGQGIKPGGVTGGEDDNFHFNSCFRTGRAQFRERAPGRATEFPYRTRNSRQIPPAPSLPAV